MRRENLGGLCVALRLFAVREGTAGGIDSEFHRRESVALFRQKPMAFYRFPSGDGECGIGYGIAA